MVYTSENTMTKVATYKCVGIDVSANMYYIAYIVLPNGEYWGVRFNGATEEIARTKAISTWNSEREKYKRLEPVVADELRHNNAKSSWDDVPDQKQHHFANKVWMRHKETRDLVRVPLTEITMYEGKGYERSGPRAK